MPIKVTRRNKMRTKLLIFVILILTLAISTLASARAPVLIIDSVKGNHGILTINYTVVDPSDVEFVTDGWQLITDDGATWLDIDAVAIGNNAPKTAGSSFITWDTQAGANNLVDKHYGSVFFRMSVKGGNIWKTKSPMPTARASLAAVTVDRKIYAIGGDNGPDTELKTVEEYDPDTNSWRKVADMPTARDHFAATALDGKIYAIGGHIGGSGGFLNTVEEYDPSTNSWRKVADMPTGRYGLAAVAVEGKVYAIGGVDSNLDDLRIVEEYNPSTDSWQKVADMPTARVYPAVAVVDGKIYAMGGFDGHKDLRIVEEYDPSTNSSRLLADMPTEKVFLAAATVDGKVYAIGGRAGNQVSNITSTVEEYNPSINSWRKVADMPTGRNGLAAAVVDGKIYAIGGYEGTYHYLNTVEEYTLPRESEIATSDSFAVGDQAVIALPEDGAFLSPVVGDLEVVSSLERCSGKKWCFNQHKLMFNSVGHGTGGGICQADDTYAWDANLNTPEFDWDEGKPVYAVEEGVVSKTYGDCINAGGSYGQLLIEHDFQGNTWWSGYLHLRDIQVTPGQNVDNNTILGYISDVGVDNNHLHFVVYKGQNSRGNLGSFDANIVTRSFSPKFNPGDYVQTTANLHLRADPEIDDNIITTIPSGSTGQVVDDENNGIFADGYCWWHVQFGSNNDWCAEDWLEMIELPTTKPVFTVVGTVRNADNTLAADGLEAIVSNETKGLTATTTLGEQESSKYGVAFVSTENKTIAVEGDSLKVIVKSEGDILGSQTYKLTSEDIAKARAIVDVKLSKKVAPDIGYAIIVTGKGDKASWPTWANLMIDGKANHAYCVLLSRGFDDDRIFYLNNKSQDVDDDGSDDVDRDTTLANFEEAITEWAQKRVSPESPLILYMVGHGSELATFELNKNESVTSIDLVKWFDENFSEETKMLIIIDACYSGSFITDAKYSISSKNRIIVTSTRDDEKNWWIFNHFSFGFWQSIQQGENVLQAFIKGSEKVWFFHPWLDDNGDAEGHPSESLDDDGLLAATMKICEPSVPAAESEPLTYATLSSPGELRVYDSKERITGLVNGNIKEDIPNSIYIEESNTVVIFPSIGTYRYEIVGTEEGIYGLKVNSVKNGEATILTATNVPTSPNSVHQYTVDWDALKEGEEAVTVKIDSDGDGTFEETINTGATFTAKEEHPWDINSDGIVDISDLVIVEQHFGESPPTEPRADVNKDGKVDISDLVLVGRHF